MASVKHRLIKQADQSTGKLHGPTVLQAMDLGLTTSFLAPRHPSLPSRASHAEPSPQPPICLSLGKAFSLQLHNSVELFRKMFHADPAAPAPRAERRSRYLCPARCRA